LFTELEKNHHTKAQRHKGLCLISILDIPSCISSKKIKKKYYEKRAVIGSSSILRALVPLCEVF
jgi:hypothetical protein